MPRPHIISPRTLKGFRDYLPETMIPRERLIDVAKRVYRSYGFAPIDTPALEYLEILQGKGGAESDQQLYRFEDAGGREVALRFDLTVPLARFVAQHVGGVGTPFKRYHIATVWRGENTQRGRYREFLQCDFDTVGTTSPVADVETVLVVHDLLSAIGFGRFTIRVNDRRVLNGVLEQNGLHDDSAAVLRALDKLPKIGRDAVAAEMARTTTATAEQAEQVLRLADVGGSAEQVFAGLEGLVADSALGRAGVDGLRQLYAAATAAGVPAARLQIDVSIARGLDYYTGTVLETYLDELPELGSVCSGGRYDDLAGVYTRQTLPGVGASLGLDRLLAGMEQLGMLEQTRTPAIALIPYFAADRLHDYLRLAAQLRAAGIGVEVYPEPRKLGKQLQYADRRGFRVALIAGEQEFAEGVIQVKDLEDGSAVTVSLAADGAEVVQQIRGLVGET